MKVRLFLAISAVLLFALPSWSSEAAPKTLVIADTGFSDSDPVIASHTVFQLCIMDWSACPNGMSFQESGTAALLNSTQIASGGFSHGSKMARAAIAVYPDVKLILVRIIGQGANGARMSTSESIVTKVLAWANKNAVTYRIGAVAISQGSNKIGSNARKCLASPATDKEVASLKAKGIYTFFPAGNEGSSGVINWPACIADAVAVGALDKSGVIASYSNDAPGQVDLYEPGYVIDTTTLPQYSTENGTSFSVQYAAARWLSLVNQFPTKRASIIYWTFAFSGDPVTNSKGQSGWNTNLDAAKASLTSQ
ncbi:Peptidases_S8_S53 domain containing protein [Candidatus Nanopelagicaceae bacterium]